MRFPTLDRHDFFEDGQSFIEADEHVHARFKKWASGGRDGPVLEMSGHLALPGIVPLPVEVTNPALEAHPRKDIRGAEKVVN